MFGYGVKIILPYLFVMIASIAYKLLEEGGVKGIFAFIWDMI